MSLIKRAYGYLIWQSKRLYRSLARLAGPRLLFWVFSVWQAVMIGRYLTDIGWHWSPAWLLAAVVGFTPFLGPLAAAKVAANVGWMGFASAAALFLTPFWLFALFALAALRIKFGLRARRALRLLRAPRLRRTGDEGIPAGGR